ncbi:MAG: SLC13 family permease [Hyphomicrobiaceae bacterium]
MLHQETILFVLLLAVLGLLLWGRWRYDFVAFGALVAALVLGVVPAEKAFDGFGHEATIVIALVLIVSRGLTNAGVVDQLGRFLTAGDRPVPLHIALMSAIAAPLSAVMNNVAALALLMPLDLQAAAKAKRPPGLTLMALSFATILGGLVTLIGTPPNIVVASFREKALGQPFGMFDFAPVGGAAALAGLVFVALVGWRLIPAGRGSIASQSGFDLHDYIAEVRVTEGSKAIGETASAIAKRLRDEGSELLAVVRKGLRHAVWTPALTLSEGDVLVIEAAAEHLDKLMSELGLEYLLPEHQEKAALEDLTLVEVVVPPGAWLEGRTVRQSGLFYHFNCSLVGVSRRGRRIHQRLGELVVEAGDVLLLLAPETRQGEIIEWTGSLPLASRGLVITKRSKAAIAAGLFVLAIVLSTAGLLKLSVALAACVLCYAALGLVGGREVYLTVEWPVVVLLGSMIPIGAALEASGGTARLADGLLALTSGAPAWVALALLMVVTMTLSDVLNNVATAVIAAPVGMAMAKALGVSPDPFLMAVAIASSCAFLTPIGHKNNILVLGPGGYRFGDYWRMGLPLEIIIVAVSLPLLLVVWPL